MITYLPGEKVMTRRRSRGDCAICGAPATRRCGHYFSDGSRCDVELCEACVDRPEKGVFSCGGHGPKSKQRRGEHLVPFQGVI